MIPNSILNALECALTSKTSFKHYIVNPITMPCGHSACKSCILRLEQPIKCLQCGYLNEIDIKKFGESIIIKCVLRNYINDLFGVIYNEMKRSFQNMKDEVNLFDKRLDEHVDYLHDEIELRITLVRMELDELSKAFKNELNDIKMKIKSRYSQINIDIQEVELENMKNIIENKERLNEAALQEYQVKIENLYKLIDDLKFNENIITFNENTTTIDKSLIGTLNINYLNHINDKNTAIIERLRTLKPNYKFIGLSPCSLLTLDENFLLLVYNDKFELYDKNINLIKTIKFINNKPINCCKAITNEKNYIYLCEHNSHKIKILDYKFNELLNTNENTIDYRLQQKKLRLTTSSQRYELYYPYELGYSNSFIYVCDLRNRIVKLNENLDFIIDYQVNFQIKQMLVTSNYICVNSYNYDKIYFLNKKTFELMNFYENHIGAICEVDSYVYEFNTNAATTKKDDEFICYFDYNGNLVDTIKTKFNSKTISFNNNVCMKKFLNKIIITSSCGKLLII